MIGIFPTTYVEIIPGADPSVTPLGTLKSMKSSSSSAVATLSTYVQEGQGKAKFRFAQQYLKVQNQNIDPGILQHMP